MQGRDQFQNTNYVTRVQSTLTSLFGRVGLLTPFQSASIIFCLSLVVKLSYILTMGGGLAAFPTEGTDVGFYDAAARNLLATGVYSYVPGEATTGMPPGQSYFLALLYAGGGDPIAFAKLAHVALLSLVAVLAYFTGREMIGASVGFWAGVLTAVDPALVYLSGTFLSDGLFIFLMMIGIYLLVRSASDHNSVWWISAGICFGLAGLTRNQGWLFSIALWLGALVTMGRLLSTRGATIVLIATVVAVAPWTWRNYQVTGQFIPVSSEGGLTLWASNNPEFVFRPPMPMSGGIYDVPPRLSETEVDQYYRQRAIQWIISHPLNFAVNGVRKIIVLYSFDPMSWRPEVAGLFRLAGLVPYGILMPFILLGLILSVGSTNFKIILWYVLFTTLMAIMFYGDSRIRAPIQPYLYILGVLGVQRVADWWRQWKGQPSAVVDAIRGGS